VTRRILGVLAGLALAACGGGDATSPTPSAVGYEGRWSGSAFTSSVPAGVPSPGAFSFTVSREQTITAIEFDYRLGACSGRISVPNLNLPLFDYAPLGRTFEYRSTDFTQPNYVTVAGSFQSDGTASGVIGLGQYNGCGDGGGSWTARR